MSEIRVVDFFCGVGGIGNGFLRSNKNYKVIFANDMDKYCEKTYNHNHKIKMTLKDINEIDVKSLPDFDVFCSGFPCQPFSVAGKRLGFDDKRSNVFFAILKILKEKRPKCIFIENVKNLRTHDKGKTFKFISESLEKLGYILYSKVLNSCEYSNIPQNRERIYIVGFLRAEIDFKFPSKIKLTKSVEDMLEDEVDDKYYYKSGSKIYDKLEEVNKQGVVYQFRRYYVRENKSGVCPTLTANMGTGGHNVPIILDDFGIRKLTPRECFNLQGYGSNFDLPDDVSNSQLYKQAGNSVTVPVIKRIASEIYKVLKNMEIKK